MVAAMKHIVRHQHIDDLIGGWKGLPRRLKGLVIFCFLLFFFQLVFVYLYLSEHILGHLLFTFSYMATVYGILDYQRGRIGDLVKAIDDTNIVVQLSLNGEIQKANKVFCDIMGFPRSELLGMEHFQLVPGMRVEGGPDARTQALNANEYMAFWKDLRDGKPLTGTYERIAKDGSPRWILGTYTPVKDGGRVIHILKVGRDVTEEINDRIALQNKNTYLEHAAKILRHDMHSGINTYIPRGIRSLERRLDALYTEGVGSKFLDKSKRSLVEDLRLDAPLRMLKEGLAHTQRVYQGVTEFTNLVKPGAALPVEDCNLRETLIDYLSSTAYRKQVIIGNLPTIRVNGPLFCTAIDNLIRNGLKYNDSPTKMVKIRQIDPKHIAVIDNGRGMTEKEFEEYSKPYVRKKNQTESGSGLGLNICIAILREHGFSVTCQELSPAGTMIRIRHD